MPVIPCTKDGKKGFKVDMPNAKCYIEGTAKENEAKANKQLKAIHVKKERGDIMATQLKNVKVDFISILTDDKQPANRRGVVLKDDNHFEIFAKFEKFDEIKGLLHITPMVGVEKDTYDEYYFNEEIEKTAHETLRSAIVMGINPIDKNHESKRIDDVHIVESHVDKSEKEWVWRAVLDISKNKDLMSKAKDGLINGVSIAGICDKVRDEPVVKVKTFEDLITNYLAKSKTFDEKLEDLQNTDIYMPLSVAWDAIYDAYYEMKDPKEFKKFMKEVFKQLLKYIDKMSFKIKKEKEGDEIMKLDKESRTEVESLVSGKLDTFKEDLLKEFKELIPGSPEPLKDGEDNEITLETLSKAVVSLVESVKGINDNTVLKNAGISKKITEYEEKLVELKKTIAQSNQSTIDDSSDDKHDTLNKEDGKQLKKFSIMA